MIRPQAVVFDLGKVLLDFDYRIAARALSGNGTCDAEDIFSVLLGTPLLLQYECGITSSAEFYQRFCSSTGYCAGPEEFARSSERSLPRLNRWFSYTTNCDAPATLLSSSRTQTSWQSNTFGALTRSLPNSPITFCRTSMVG
jgi:hypothetical protein